MLNNRKHLTISIIFTAIIFSSLYRCSDECTCYSCTTTNDLGYATEFRSEWVCSEKRRKKLENDGWRCTEESEVNKSESIVGPGTIDDTGIVLSDTSDCDCGN